ncbi:MAG: DNA-deoxyinosine glycosylase [Bacteroidetes bacterium]|nr:MAG: DNA-deoxyinosine glycosylase [Bacteroidota bacterium]
MLVSFKPIISSSCKILILGTMPGIKSLEENQYYAHKRNAFWPIIYKLFDEKISKNYDDRKAFALKNNIALWDTLKLCLREGSLDSKIKEEQANEIHQLLMDYPLIHTIIFNGKSAEKFYNKYYKQQKSISYITLPSTSPANAGKTFDEKLSYWTIISKQLNIKR